MTSCPRTPHARSRRRRRRRRRRHDSQMFAPVATTSMSITRLISPSSSAKLTARKSSLAGGSCTSGKTTSANDRVSTSIVAGKMKTRKSAAKRYKVTASGKVRARSFVETSQIFFRRVSPRRYLVRGLLYN